MIVLVVELDDELDELLESSSLSFEQATKTKPTKEMARTVAKTVKSFFIEILLKIVLFCRETSGKRVSWQRG